MRKLEHAKGTEITPRDLAVEGSGRRLRLGPEGRCLASADPLPVSGALPLLPSHPCFLVFGRGPWSLRGPAFCRVARSTRAHVVPAMAKLHRSNSPVPSSCWLFLSIPTVSSAGLPLNLSFSALQSFHGSFYYQRKNSKAFLVESEVLRDLAHFVASAGTRSALPLRVLCMSLSLCPPPVGFRLHDVLMPSPPPSRPPCTATDPLRAPVSPEQLPDFETPHVWIYSLPSGSAFWGGPLHNGVN